MHKISQVFFILFIFLLFTGCGAKEISLEHTMVQTGREEVPVHEDKKENDREEKDPEETEAKEEQKEEVAEITITAVGDILLHGTVYEDARKGDTYDFMPMFQQVRPYLEDSTITFANQETMIGGEELGLSSYPRFNSPFEIGDALKESGVDIVSIANNHTLDKGEKAIQNATAYWDEIEMPYVGAYKDEEDAQTIRVLETDEGIDVAFLAYTYGTNGIPIPDGKEYLVNMIEEEKMEKDIKEAEALADITIVSLHFGEEYIRMPNDAQKELVQFVADLEVDAVFGHHPHVLQPAAWVEGKKGNETLVIYSLGNFLSAQDELHRLIGGIFQFKVKKTTSGQEEKIELHTPAFLPTYNYYENWRDYEVIPLHEVSETQLKNAQKHYKETKEHMTQWMPDLEFIE